MKKYPITNYWDEQLIKLNVEQLTWVKSHWWFKEAFRQFRYTWQKLTISFGKDTDFRSAIKYLTSTKK